MRAILQNRGLAGLAAVVCALALAGCSHLVREVQNDLSTNAPACHALQQVKTKYAPDSHLRIFSVGLGRVGTQLVLTGVVDQAEARTNALQAVQALGLKPVDQIQVLPAAELGEETWGIGCLSAAPGREGPEHKAEMGTQILMGGVVRLWQRTTNFWIGWDLAQSADGYLSWLEEGTFVRCNRAQVEAWQQSPLLVVTAFEDRILEKPEPEAEPVSDVVMANLVKKIGEQGDWFEVALPDARHGFLPRHSAVDYQAWRQARCATPENIERTARRFLGRPYLWGANSPKGLDCSGFTKLVFWLNGVDLLRNASHQARQGRAVPLDRDLSQLRKGDLLFFGAPAQGDRPERVRHVGIYLGDKLFIHSSERVRINSLDPASPLRDENRIRTLLRVRRVLPES